MDDGMIGILVIGFIVYLIYNAGSKRGYKKGNREGSRKGYNAGRASSARTVISGKPNKSGCFGLFFLLIASIGGFLFSLGFYLIF